MTTTRRFCDFETHEAVIPASYFQRDGDFIENVETFLREEGAIPETQALLSMQVRFDKVEGEIDVMSVETQSNLTD